MTFSKLFLIIILIAILAFLSYSDSLVTHSICENEFPLQKTKEPDFKQVPQDSFFTEIPDSILKLQGVNSGSVAWGDYDNDNDLDILLAGSPGFGGFSEIYLNDNGNFQPFRGYLEGVCNSSVACGDYDNDGDLDILLTGFTTDAKYISKIYRNNNGQFEEMKSELEGVSFGSVAWGDFDNDGDLDILLTGKSTVGDVSIIYCNNDTSFDRLDTNLPGVRFGSVAWGDYDNDLDLDILLIGYNSSTISYITKVYRNDNGNFVDANINLPNIRRGSAAWGDYDNDSDLDILLTGETPTEYISKIYRNNDGQFEDIGAGLTGVTYGSAAWGDYNNDGNLDILLTGQDSSNVKVSKIYRNNHGQFEDISAGLLGVNQSSIAWGDYDNDGDLDILLTGQDSSYKLVSKIYRNNIDSLISVPSPPIGLMALVHGDSVILSWNKSNDNETSQNALTYNLRVGTTPGGVEIMSPMANLNSGYRMVPKLGNVNHNNSWVIKNLKESINHYYWSVQSIDNSFAGSQFAQEDSFIIGSRPEIIHTSKDSLEENLPANIEATVDDDFGVKSVMLYCRRGGDITITFSDSMKWQDEKYQVKIPGSMVTLRGLEYAIEAKDFGGFEDREPPSGFFSIPVYDLYNNGVKKDSLQPFGSDQFAYRQISVPLDLYDKNPKAVLENDLGTYDDTKWRFFEPFPDGSFSEFPKTSLMIPGKAFWLIVKQAEKTIDTGPGITNLTSKPFSIPLQPGWNSIGNPFNFIIPLNHIYLKSTGNSPELRYFDGNWNDPIHNAVKQILPFEGYAICNNLSDVDTLFINPDLSDTTSRSLPYSDLIHKDDIIWEIRIFAQCQKAIDGDNIASLMLNASNSWDVMDRPEPPVIGEYVSIYFPHPEWEKNASNYCTDSRPEPLEGNVWEFEVKTNIHDKIKLSFEEFSTIPDQYSVWLLDEQLKTTQNLQNEGKYYVAGPTEEHPKRLKIVAGKYDFVQERINKVQFIPTSIELFQNFPNPFNPATTIRYGLPATEKVTIKVYNILGEEIAVLVNNELKSAGYHISIWDARDEKACVVANGIYIYQLRVDNVTISRKMFLIK